MMRSIPHVVFTCLLPLILASCSSNKPTQFKTSYEAGLQAYQQGDYQLALIHWQPLAESGDQRAQFGVARMYDVGQGAPQNHQKAFQWYMKAAKQGNARAQTNLGKLYAQGEGVEQNLSMCYVWSSLAATNGESVAVNNREECKGELTTSQLEEAQELAEQYWQEYNP